MCRKACYDTENGEVYCPQCAPDIEPEFMPQETDCPENCADCGAHLEYELTSNGVDYVMDYVIDALESGIDDSIIGPEDRRTYYRGMPECSIVGDWARDLKLCGYGSRANGFVLDQFIELVEEVEQKALDASTVRPDVPSA